jgi:hypothetical protein
MESRSIDRRSILANCRRCRGEWITARCEDSGKDYRKGNLKPQIMSKMTVAVKTMTAAPAAMVASLRSSGFKRFSVGRWKFIGPETA